MFTTVPVASFFVRGEPAPGGSKTFMPAREKNGSIKTEWKERAGGRGQYESVIGFYMDAGGKRNEAWKKIVAWTGKDIFRGQLLDKPLSVVMTFYMPRPLCAFGSGRNASILKPSADEFHMQDPDSTKLQRSTEDALNGIAWVDDNRVQQITSRKLWNTYNETPGHLHYPGCLIEISEIVSTRPATLELALTIPAPCPPPISTPTPTTDTTGTSIGFDAMNPGDSPF